MKKAAIITFEFNYNFGAILQATALSYFIRNCGYEVDIVNRGWGELPLPTNILSIKNLLSSSIGKYYTLRDLKKFKDKYWSLTSSFRTEQDLSDCINCYDTVVIGSDQIWNSACIPIQGLYYFGINADPRKQKLIAYAPSFGKNRFETSSQNISILSKHLKKFKALSVRETDGCDILSNIFGIKDVPCVLDPTMLMDVDFYAKLAKIKKSDSKTLAYYILDMTSEKRNFIDAFAKKYGFSQVNMNLPEKIKSNNLFVKLRSLKYPSIESWLEKIANSQFVITDSFHGSVFSILFNKQFLTFGNAERGLSRFKTLFSRFGLEERMCDPQNVMNIVLKDIDYSNVNAILEEERNKSAEFLKAALK